MSGSKNSWRSYSYQVLCNMQHTHSVKYDIIRYKSVHNIHGYYIINPFEDEASLLLNMMAHQLNVVIITFLLSIKKERLKQDAVPRLFLGLSNYMSSTKPEASTSPAKRVRYVDELQNPQQTE